MKTMKKTITKKCIGTLLASIVLTTYPTVLSRAQTINTLTNQNTIWNETTFSEISEKQIRNTSHLTNGSTQKKRNNFTQNKRINRTGHKFRTNTNRNTKHADHKYKHSKKGTKQYVSKRF
jgi:hypothetical protein